MKSVLQFLWLTILGGALGVGLSLFNLGWVASAGAAFGMVFAFYGLAIKAPQQCIEQVWLWFSGE